MANEIATTSEQSQITSKLLSDYFATLTDKLTDVQRNQFAAVAQAFGLNRVGDIDFGPARASVRSIEFYCVVASLAATGARLAASRNISISTTGAITAST